MSDHICLNCGCDTELHDSTYSNYDSGRCYRGQHTGNIYKCLNDECQSLFIADYVNNDYYEWSY